MIISNNHLLLFAFNLHEEQHLQMDVNLCQYGFFESVLEEKCLSVQNLLVYFNRCFKSHWKQQCVAGSGFGSDEGHL